jgi:hypothetical protein
MAGTAVALASRGGTAVVCLTCGRVRPANDRSEYTTERGLMVAERGLCVCVAPQRGTIRSVECVELPEEALALPSWAD